MAASEHRVWRARHTAGTGSDAEPWHAARDIRWVTALGRGAAARCPVCGEGHIFEGYLSLRPTCPVCAAPLGDLPADDAPPWVTMFIALHILVGAVVVLGQTTSFGTVGTLAVMLPMAVLLCAALLRPVKGCVVAVLLKVDVSHGSGSS